MNKASGRENQKLRTRQNLLEAAVKCLASGDKPTLEEVAEAAMVSRATAYRYYPNVDELLLEATLHLAANELDQVFAGDELGSSDPLERLRRAEAVTHDMVVRNEPQFRMMLAQTLMRGPLATDPDKLPVRLNRRSKLIEQALLPARDEFSKKNFDLLSQASALLFGIESMIVCRDVLELDHDQAEALKQWILAMLVQGARKKQ